MEAPRSQPSAGSGAKPKEQGRVRQTPPRIYSLFCFFCTVFQKMQLNKQVWYWNTLCILPTTNMDLCRDSQNFPSHASFVCALFGRKRQVKFTARHQLCAKNWIKELENMTELRNSKSMTQLDHKPNLRWNMKMKVNLIWNMKTKKGCIKCFLYANSGFFLIVSFKKIYSDGEEDFVTNDFDIYTFCWMLVDICNFL